VSVEEFLDLLTQHVPDRYAHNIRYFGLASPAGKHLFSSAVFTLLREEQKPRPKRLSFEAMSIKHFDFNPLLHSHGSACTGLAGKTLRSFQSSQHKAMIPLTSPLLGRTGIIRCAFLRHRTIPLNSFPYPTTRFLRRNGSRASLSYVEGEP
jgi:hypothetical protein